MVAPKMATETPSTTSRLAPTVLMLAGVGVVAAYAATGERLRSIDGLPQAVVTGACLLSAIVILLRSRRPEGWRRATWLGLGCLGLGVVNAAFLLPHMRHHLPS